jgi:hypothetical protein
MKRTIALCLSVVLFACAPVAAQDCLDYVGMPIPTIEGEHGLDPLAVDLTGAGQLVIAERGGVTLLDLSDPSQPTPLGSYTFSPFSAHCELATRGQLIFLAYGEESCILDAGDPTNLVKLADLDDGSRYLDVLGDLLAIRTDAWVVDLYDIADPAAPVLLATIAESRQPRFLDAQRLALLGTGFTILDLSDPAAPVETHRVDYSFDPSTYYEGVPDLVAWGDELVGVKVSSMTRGSHVMGDYYYRRYLRTCRWVLEESGQVTCTESTIADFYQTIGANLTGARPLRREGALLIHGRDLMRPDSGSLLPVGRLPDELMVPGGLQILLDGDAVMVTHDRVITVPAAALENANAITIAGGFVSQGYHGWAAGGSELLGSVFRPYSDHPTEDILTVQQGPGGPRLDVTPFAYWSDPLWFADNNVFIDRPGEGHYYIADGAVQVGALSAEGAAALLDGPGAQVIELRGDELRIHDLSDPAAPILEGSLDLGGAGLGPLQGGAVRGDRLLVFGSVAVALVSLADPAAPQLTATAALAGVSWIAFWGDDRATAGDGVQLHRLEFADPDDLQISFSVPRGDVASPLQTSGDYAYCLGGPADETDFMQILLLDLATLETVGTMATNEAVSALQVGADGSVLAIGDVFGWQPLQPACAAIAVAVTDQLPQLADTLGVYPNPFNPQTSVVFALARAGRARLAIFDARGRRVRAFELGRLAAGRHRVAWDGRDGTGRAAPAGVYLLQLTTPAGVSAAKAALVK